MAVQFLLEAAGYRLLTAASAAEALHRLERSAATPDLLITDIQMPGTTGLELLEALRRLRPDLPVLVMTGYWSGELGRRLSALHCEQWIEKPFEEEQLLEKVREMLRAQEETP